MSYSTAPTVQDIAHLPCASLPDLVHVPPLTRPFNVTITPPGSKSLTNRALLLAALADGESTLTNALIDADDTRVMITALRQLGAEISVSIPLRAGGGGGGAASGGGAGGAATPGEAATGGRADPPSETTSLHIRGTSGRWRIPPEGVTLNLENAGTAVRFLTAAAILAAPGSGPITIDGNARMRERPIGELVDALRTLGAVVETSGERSHLPLRIGRVPPNRARELVLGRTDSSQFISALLLVAPFLPRGLTIRMIAEPTSAPYVEMTERLLRSVGIHLDSTTPGLVRGWGKNPGTLHLPRSNLAAFSLAIEADLSAAAPFWAAAALVPGSRLDIGGIDIPLQTSLQGDAQFLLILDHVAGPTGYDSGEHFATGADRVDPLDEINLSDIPDTAMTAAVLACFASPTSTNPTATSTLRGLRTLRHKESDRLAALQTELTKLGAIVEIETTPTDEALRITPPPNLPTPSSLRGSVASSLPPLTFDTYNDHRMAMSLALVGLRRPNVFIKNPACVAKTYPTFWRDMVRLYQP